MRPLAVECADCGSAMTLRRNRESGDAFLGCRSYPRCKYTERYDETLGELLAENLELRDRLELLAGSDHGAATFDHKLRGLLFQFHPDRRETIPAHEIAVALNLLRQEVATA